MKNIKKTFKSLFNNNLEHYTHEVGGAGNTNSYVYGIGKPVWTERNYQQLAEHAYIKNVIAHNAINLIAKSAASIELKVHKIMNGIKYEVTDHPIINVLKYPHPLMSGTEMLEQIYTYRQIHGNAFLLFNNSKEQARIYSLRPDRVNVLAGANFTPLGYRYTVDEQHQDYFIDMANGHCEILHIKNFHPLSDWYGLSSIEAAAYSIDQHNQAGAWNQALLQNGARPSGVVTVKDTDGKPATLSVEQFNRVKNMIDESFTGSTNAGKPILLEGGLEWKDMSLSPRDMDFISSKHSSARDIALAFGVPPQILGIPGDNTYNNLKEARVSLWEQTIIPLIDNTLRHLNRWLVLLYDKNFEISYNKDSIPALCQYRNSFWRSIDKINFINADEKRTICGFAATEKQKI